MGCVEILSHKISPLRRTYRVFQKKQSDLFVLYQNGKKHMKKEGELSVINISVVCNLLFIVYRR